MFSEFENSDATSENMEQEIKINVEEACVNLGYMKKELDEEELEFQDKQYKIALTFENMFEGSLTEQRSNRDTVIGFLHGDVIMETGSAKLEDIKEENKDLMQRTIAQSHCNKCGGNYQGYCLNCSSLSHIMNNLTPNLNPELVLNTMPINMVEIKEVSRGCAVFALKTLPKSIILGPFEGVAPIESTTGLQWKIKDKKLVTDQNGNWMKYIQSVANSSSKNLDVFQIDGILYFETSREIQEGEELLVCYNDEKDEVLKSYKEEFYLVRVMKEGYPKVFACTLCCLGFRLERCLVEHKSKCPQGHHGGNIEDFEIIQCRCCKVWLEKQEHLVGHMLHCFENYNRLYHNIPTFQRKLADEIGEIQGNREISMPLVENRSYLALSGVIHSKHSDEICTYKKGYFKKYKCSECPYQTSRKYDLNRHLNTYHNIKTFECVICKKAFTQKRQLQMHIRNQHSNTIEKEYKCSECSYQTNLKSNLTIHIRNQHSNTGEKEYKCSECSYQTNLKCYLTFHIRNRHLNTSEKEYKCSECFYETNRKCHLDRHLNTHHNIKTFECEICKKGFTQKSQLQMHIRNQHSNTNEKEYKCSECTYQSNSKYCLNIHLNNQHIKPFECDICKKGFTKEGGLKQHVIAIHSNTNETEYKCCKCSYQTNYKWILKIHLNTHKDIKPFECGICKKGFSQKSTVNSHLKDKHSNTSEKEYECSECCYQTNYNRKLISHLNAHFRIHYRNHLETHLNTHMNTSEYDSYTFKYKRRGIQMLHVFLSKKS